MMPGRAQHPTDHGRAHARRTLRIAELRQAIIRLGVNINDDQQHRLVAKRELKKLEREDAAARVA
jgi:hypothetical protein